jgi:hypothetical protein
MLLRLDGLHPTHLKAQFLRIAAEMGELLVPLPKFAVKPTSPIPDFRRCTELRTKVVLRTPTSR